MIARDQAQVEHREAVEKVIELKRIRKTAELRMLCTEKELALARVELLRVGVKNPGESYLGKRRRFLLEGTETESAEESESRTEQSQPDPEGENEGEPEVNQE